MICVFSVFNISVNIAADLNIHGFRFSVADDQLSVASLYLSRLMILNEVSFSSITDDASELRSYCLSLFIVISRRKGNKLNSYKL